MKITKGQLTLAGWLSITNAIFAIPSIAMSWFLETKGGAGAKLSQAILTLVSLGLFLYVIISLRKLLNYRFQFHQTDIYISLLIWGNMILTAFSLLALGNQEFGRFSNVLSIVSLIILGILAIMFATRLQRFPGDLYGLLKPFCYTTIASGICFITVFLAPVGSSFLERLSSPRLLWKSSEHPSNKLVKYVMFDNTFFFFAVLKGEG
jgi:amino acid transporter